jgi:hypothetical protein
LPVPLALSERRGSLSLAYAEAPSPVRRVQLEVLGDLALPAIAIRQEPLLVVVKLFPCFGGELEIRPLHDRIDRAGFLAEAAIDAFHHVDVVTGGAARAVLAARARFDGDGLGRTDGLAQLAGDAALLAVGIAPQRMLAAEAWRQRPLFVGVVERRLRADEIFQGEPEG